MTSSYSNITQNITKKKEKELTDNDRLLINGYTIIRKNKNKIVKVTSKNTERKIENIKKEIEEKNYNDKCYNLRSKMINNRNNFRDTENSLSGDLSRFYNYKNELNNMLEEEEFILEKMNIMNINYMSDSDNSDDDMNKNLLY